MNAAHACAAHRPAGSAPHHRAGGGTASVAGPPVRHTGSGGCAPPPFHLPFHIEGAFCEGKAQGRAGRGRRRLLEWPDLCAYTPRCPHILLVSQPLSTMLLHGAVPQRYYPRRPLLAALGPSRADLKEQQGDFKYPGVDDSWDKGMIHLRYECHRVSSSDADAPPLQ